MEMNTNPLAEEGNYICVISWSERDNESMAQDSQGI